MPNTSPSLTDFYIYQFIYFTNLYWFYLLNIPHIYSLIYLPSKYPSYILTLSSLVHVVGSSPQNCYSHSIFSFKTITYLNWRLITLQFCDFFFTIYQYELAIDICFPSILKPPHFPSPLYPTRFVIEHWLWVPSGVTFELFLL